MQLALDYRRVAYYSRGEEGLFTSLVEDPSAIVIRCVCDMNDERNVGLLIIFDKYNILLLCYRVIARELEDMLLKASKRDGNCMSTKILLLVSRSTNHYINCTREHAPDATELPPLRCTPWLKRLYLCPTALEKAIQVWYHS